MVKYRVSDVMVRKVDDKSIGYIVVITCEGANGATVSNSVFVESKDLPLASKENITIIAENWLKQKDGLLTRADAMADKAVNISEEQVKTLIPTAELRLLRNGGTGT